MVNNGLNGHILQASCLIDAHVQLFYVISKDNGIIIPKIGALANLISSPCNRTT